MEYKKDDEILWRLNDGNNYPDMLEHGRILEIRENVILIERKKYNEAYETGWYLKDDIVVFDVLK